LFVQEYLAQNQITALNQDLNGQIVIKWPNFAIFLF